MAGDVEPREVPKQLWEVLREEFVALGGDAAKEGDAGPSGDAAKAGGERADAGREFERIVRRVHEHNRASVKDAAVRPRAALCFSGGGIRSATFNLGLLQRLIELRLLDQFDYLSTVSGGGYLGSWLGAWIHRAEQGLPTVVEEMRRSCGKGNGRSASEPEAAPLRHLRTFSRYLAPELGILSADAWTLASIYLRNLVLNWTVLVPLLLAALMVPRILLALIARDPVAPLAGTFGISGEHWLWAPLALGLVFAVVAFAYAGSHQPSAQRMKARAKEGERRPPASPQRGQARFLRGCWLPFLLASLLVSMFWGWRRSGAPDGTTGLWMVAVGVGLGLVGWTFLFITEGRTAQLHDLLAVVAGGAVAGAGTWGSAALLAGIAPIAPVSPIGAWSADQGRAFAAFVTLSFPLVLASLTLGGTIYVGWLSRKGASGDDDREWWARCGGWLLIALACWLAASVVTLFGPALLVWMAKQATTTLAAVGGASGLVSILLGRSGDTAGGGREGSAGAMGAVKRWALALAAPVFLALLLAAASLATSGLIGLCLPEDPAAPHGHFEVLANATPKLVAGWFLALLAFGLLMSRLIDLNRFSMHAMYRDRLVRGYLGASRAKAREPDEFTGFDPADNLSMFELRPEMLRARDVPAPFLARLRKAARAGRKRAAEPAPPDAPAEKLVLLLGAEALRELETLPDPLWPLDDGSKLLAALNVVLAGAELGDAAPGAERRSLRNRVWLAEQFGLPAAAARPLAPLHVVNVALNLVSGEEPAWQERKAESFTVTPLHCGAANLDYRDSHAYGGDRGISLGTAMTISGAAVSPNMGYHSSPFVAVLLTLFNVRLGWWLGNPGTAGRTTWRLANPKYTIEPIVAEAFGLTDACHSYVYLSDGGHFENLGLYEMVRRRCRFIVLGDAGADPGCTFEDLGNAIRKIRIDFGIPITFSKPLAIHARDDEDPKDGSCFALGEIDYSAVDGGDAPPGQLLYVKPAFYGKDEPKDVYTYAKASETFPHEATSDQFFSEAQFESYRALGYHAMRTATRGLDEHSKPDLRRLFDAVRGAAEPPLANPSNPET
ncbi:MAG TPA: patatin-like phospholipase family protein [Planctomycetota bacterium]|jgi:hypothetical protein|nr:patatin-like phospholipase family protein [Planctomycetota bacterium]